MNRQKLIKSALFLGFLALLAGCQRATRPLPPVTVLPSPQLGALDVNASIFHR